MYNNVTIDMNKTQSCIAAGLNERPAALQLHQEMDSDSINLGAATLN